MRMPLPSFSWAKGAEVWNCMMGKDDVYSKLRNENMLHSHPSLVESYRTILLDWLSEVSQECKFHRETYHLAVDFIDRYLSASTNVNKLQLQLIGTTCLFIAAKIEEIRPPSVTEFADLTDGACKAEEIINNEVVILSAINWDMTPMTPNSWLSVYMQILLNLDKENDPNNCNTSSATTITHANHTTKNDSFILPINNGLLISCHRRIASVIDLALLHLQTLRFPNSVLTASALYHFTDEFTVNQCTGYELKDLAECIKWLAPFVDTIKDIRGPVFMASCGGQSNPTQMHAHIATASLLEKVLPLTDPSTPSKSAKRKAIDVQEEDTQTLCSSPVRQTFIPTPPQSVKKRCR